MKSGVRGVLRGLGGELEVFIHKIPVWINDHPRIVRVAFASGDVTNVLGRLDLLKHTSWTFLDEQYFFVRTVRKISRKRRRVGVAPMEPIDPTSLFDSIPVSDKVDFTDPHSLRKALLLGRK